jgi:phage-related baseplate assembly protein
MPGTFTAVDLSRLPFPAVVEPLNFESIFAAMLADLVARWPAFSALVESDPAYKVLQVAAYRELLMRARVNDAAKATTLAYATGSDLDQIAARYNVARLVIDAGDPLAVPPRPAELETDTALRRRVQLAFEGFSTAGPVGAYLFHTLSAHADVADASVVSDIPGIVEVYVLSRGASGVPAPSVLDAVLVALNAEDVRPLTDLVQVYPVDVVPYTIDAEITVFDGPDASVVMAAAEAEAEHYVETQRAIGLPATRSGIFAALHRPGVLNVNLLQPPADVLVSGKQIALCTGIALAEVP